MPRNQHTFPSARPRLWEFELMQLGGGPSFREGHPLGTTAFEFLQISCVRVVCKRLCFFLPVSCPAIILDFSLDYECLSALVSPFFFPAIF